MQRGPATGRSHGPALSTQHSQSGRVTLSQPQGHGPGSLVPSSPPLLAALRLSLCLPILLPVLPVPLALPPLPLLFPFSCSPPSPMSVFSSICEKFVLFHQQPKTELLLLPALPRRASGRPLPHAALQAQAHFRLLSSSKRLEPSKETLCPLGWLPGEAGPGMPVAVT